MLQVSLQITQNSDAQTLCSIILTQPVSTQRSMRSVTKADMRAKQER